MDLLIDLSFGWCTWRSLAREQERLVETKSPSTRECPPQPSTAARSGTHPLQIAAFYTAVAAAFATGTATTWSGQETNSAPSVRALSREDIRVIAAGDTWAKFGMNNVSLPQTARIDS